MNDSTPGLRQRLQAGEVALGTMLTLPCPSLAEILALVGFEWFFIDGEHGALDVPAIQSLMQAVPQVPCLVRVPDSAEAGIKRVLDAGATGVIVPQVNSAQQATEVVRASRYAPLGARGVGLARAHGYGMRFASYVAEANERVVVVVQAEHIEAVRNIEAIASVPGIDAVLIGPYDLAASMGQMGQVDAPEVVEAIQRVTQVCRQAGVPLGIFGVSAEALRPYLEQGFTLIVGSVDAVLLSGAGRRLLESLRP